MLKVTGLTRTFRSGDQDVHALDNVNFEIADGEFTSIIGKSGSGKSTLLSQLGALDKPTQGSIEVNGKDVTRMHDHALIRYRSETIGFIFQSYNLVPNLTAVENVMLPMECVGMRKKERKQRAQLLLDQVGLDEAKQKRKPGKLSGGEQQRVAVARALANKPGLILADEPTGNLDTQTGDMIFKMLYDLSQSHNTTVVIVTHDLGIAKKADRIFQLQDGKLQERFI